MTVPRATMRLQLHRDFTFADATDLVPYLAALGISHLYASPILTARPGSIHGYDVTDPTKVNPELGGEAGLRRLVATLRAAGLGLIITIAWCTAPWQRGMSATARCPKMRSTPETRTCRGDCRPIE